MNLIYKISNHIGWVTIILISHLSISLIPLDVSNIIFLPCDLIRGSAKFISDFT
jgi:hypothetical protein